MKKILINIKIKMSTFLRDPRFASKNFGTKNEILNRFPKAKFLYFVKFNPGYVPIKSDPINEINDMEKGISFLVQRVDRPRINFDIETLSQYNKKRIVQKTHRFEPVSITFYDTYDDRVIAYFIDYYKWYYGEPTATSRKDWDGESIEEVFEKINSDFSGIIDINSRIRRSDVLKWFGFNPPLSGINPSNPYKSASSFRHFNSIDIITFGCNVASCYRLVNPIISRFEPSDLDATDTNSISTTTITVDYEAVIWPEDFVLQTDLIERSDIGSLILNGENPDSKDSAYLPEEERIKVKNYPFKKKNVNIKEDFNIVQKTGLDRFRPNLSEANTIENVSKDILSLEKTTNLIGGVNYGSSLSDNRFRTGITSLFNGPFSSLRNVPRINNLEVNGIAGRIGNFRIPGTNPILNDIKKEIIHEKYAEEKNVSSKLGNEHDLIIGLVSNLGIKDKKMMYIVANKISEISKITGLSPIDVVNRYNLVPESQKNKINVISLDQINKSYVNYSVQQGVLGQEESDYSFNMEISLGNQFYKYDIGGKPTNIDDQNIDIEGYPIHESGKKIVNVKDENKPKLKINPNKGQVSWLDSNNSIDYNVIQSLLNTNNI
ncbi:MAG: hypothetical protein NZZ41_00450 [Candidatus Dojkabacteria bacterium]|nr:hypothetical protein [Candidatus Dojkabacteria bacterium]